MSITPQQLLESALTRHRGVLSCDIVFGDDAGASVGHDDREAPFVPDDGDGEEPGFLISITDEDPERLCAVVRVAEDSDVLGVGIDLASTEDWTQDERGERFAELLFTEHEKALISAADGCFYAQQQVNGTWLIGGDSNYEIYDATYPKEVTFSFSAPRIARFFLEYMPTLKGVKVIRSWSGLLDMCWDGCPVISKVEEVPGLYLGCAFTGHGFGVGPAAGYVLAQMAKGEEPAVDLSGLRYDRFRLPSH